MPRGWAGERIFVRLDAATHEGVVYVDDSRVAEHVGGYTPFEADITDVVTPGEEFRLTIGVSNELTNTTIPPGKVVVGEDGGRTQEYLHDFFNYAGLARSVWLYSAPAVRVSDITVTTDVEGSTGIVGYRRRDDRRRRRSAWRFATPTASRGRASATGGAGDAARRGRRPVAPGAAYLYELTVELRRRTARSSTATR